MKKLLLLASIILGASTIIVSLPPQLMKVQVESQQKLANERTEESIRQMWQQAKPTYTGSPFVEMPSYKAPYVAGSLHEEFIDDGKRMVEFVRYLADMPPTITLNEELTKSSQAYSVVQMVAYDPQNPHNPSKPADMRNKFYKASLLNNSYEVLHFDQRNLSEATIGFTDDSGSDNEVNVGHRMSLLEPTYTSVGMGYSLKGDTSYSVMRGTTIGENEYFDYDYIAWPNKGAFPLEYIENADVWSFTLNENKYEPLNSSVSVSITSKQLGKTWILNEEAYKENPKNIFHVQSNQVTFFPQALRKRIHTAGSDTFHVTIHGVQKRNKAPKDIEYDVKLFPLENKIVETKAIFKKKTFMINEPLQYEPYVTYSNGTSVKLDKNTSFKMKEELENGYYYLYEKDDVPNDEVGTYAFGIYLNNQHESISSLTVTIKIVPAKKTTIQSLSANVESFTLQGKTKASSKVVINVQGKTYKTQSTKKGQFTLTKAAFKTYKNKQATVTVYDQWNNKIATKKVVFK